MRRIASLTAFLSMFFILLTSTVLFIVPQGRVAYWADWKLWGLSKDDWTAIHINSGILFLAALVIHTFYNWNSITLYLRNKRRQVKIFTVDFNLALALTLLFVAGTQFVIPPFSTIIDINTRIKEAAVRKYGDPPYGHAELSTLRDFSRHMDLDLERALRGLAEAGYTVESDLRPLKEIALANGVAPQEIYLAMVRGSLSANGQRMPEKPGQGLGKLTLGELCTRYGLNTDQIVNALQEKNIRSEVGMSLKQVAELNGLSAMEVYDTIRKITDQDSSN
ncbi:MAG: DUF4405 domain-containing protein [Syntrophotaleaceae bacterium]